MAFENKIHINCIGGLTTFLGSFLTFGTGIAFLLPSKSSTMKINLIPTKKLALLSAVFCAAMLAFSQNASAVTNLTTNEYLGLMGPTSNNGSNLLSDADQTDAVNQLIGLALGGSASPIYGGQEYFLFRSDDDFGPLPGPAVSALSGNGASISIGSGLYSYLFAAYSQGSNTQYVVWYIG